MDFSYSYLSTDTPNLMQFVLHSHDSYELYLFLNGDCEYIVEGVTYPLHPNDLIIINDSEMHRVRHKTAAHYERQVINISRRFFEDMQCPELEKIFLEKKIGKNSKLDSLQVEHSGLLDAFKRFGRYYENAPDNRILLSGVLVEILYILNNMDISSRDAAENKQVNGIIDYINSNICDELNLRDIADRFYISKYHLCRIFKAETGLTVNKYINLKRIMLVKKYCADGMNISRACMEAGFSNYSTFYRSYVKEFNRKPKEEFRRE